MELQGSHQFKAPLEAVWQALMDPAVLAKALPGGDQLERVGENDYKAAMNVRMGAVQGRFEGKVTLTDVMPLQGYHMQVSGQGTPGFLSGSGVLHLAANAEGTLLTYSGDVQIGGRIAAVGQRLIDSTARSMIRQGFRTLEEQLLVGADDTATYTTSGSRVVPPPTSIPPVTPVASSTTLPTVQARSAPTSTASDASSAAMGRMAVEIAKDVAQEFASDYIPRQKQPQAFAFILGALSMLLFVILVRLVQRN
jgi:carbon monoxide dehydrogenase subunit G